MENNELTPASIEELEDINWKELEAMCEETRQMMEVVNLVPLNTAAEQYIVDRYPIHAFFARSEIQEIARNLYGTSLTENEIKDVNAEFVETFAPEIEEAISKAMQVVIATR